MTDASDESLWEVRPPWPNEFARLERYLPLNRMPHSRALAWVLVTGRYERIVGRAQCEVPEDGSRRGARIEWLIREGWTACPAAAALIVRAAQAGFSSGAPRIRAQVEVGTPGEDLFQGLGFKVVSRHEIWTIPVKRAITAREAVTDRQRKRFPLPVAALEPGALPAIRELCGRLGLLQGERINLRTRETEGYDPRFSFVVGNLAKPLGAALCRFIGPHLYLEVLGRDPSHREPGVVPALLRAVFISAREHGVGVLGCTLTLSDKAHPAAALLRRGGAERLRQHAVVELSGPLA